MTHIPFAPPAAPVSDQMYVSMYRGHGWARVMYVALASLGFLFAYKLAPGRLALGGYLAAAYLVGTAVDIVNVVLLLTPASTAWFRNQRRG